MTGTKTISLTPEQRRARVQQRLKHDHEFFARNCLTIVNKRGELVPFEYNAPQSRGAKAFEAQRLAGQPMRIVDLKARQLGMSTRAQGCLIQRATQTPHHHSLVAAHSGKTVGALFRMGKGMAGRLPDAIRPTIAYENNSLGRQYLHWGEPARALRQQGITGLESSYTVATAKEAQDGRGLTFRTVHLSEVAFWDKEDMMLGVLNAVPDDPDTLIMVESTANGENFYQEFWDAAESGSSGYIAMFSAWFEDVGYRKTFANDIERARFYRGIGNGPKRKDEHKLIPMIREYWEEAAPGLDEEHLELLVLEYLHWRLWAIDAKTKRSVVEFMQEYPSTPDEAFKSTGRRVFGVEFVTAVRDRVKKTDPVSPTEENRGPATGIFEGQQMKTLASSRSSQRAEVPQKALWVPESKVDADIPIPWKRWEAPVRAHARPVIDNETGEVSHVQVPDGQYIIAADVMSGEENEGALARHAIEVINHRTLKQCAEYDSQVDPDILAMELLLAALEYNRAWIAVEVTGGWGLPVARRLARDFHYPRVFLREQEDARMDNMEDRLGWDTNGQTKPILLARGSELLRNGIDGIRSHELAMQLGYYVYDEKGRSKPQPGKLSDRLMAWLIAQEVAARRPIRPDRPRGAISTTGR